MIKWFKRQPLENLLVLAVLVLFGLIGWILQVAAQRQHVMTTKMSRPDIQQHSL